MTSYKLESNFGTLLGYYSLLRVAKSVAKHYAGSTITKLNGPSFGEGYHVYKLYYNGSRFHKGYKGE